MLAQQESPTQMKKDDTIFFVLDGTLRSFTVDHDGNKHVMQFAFESHWISNLSSFITQRPEKCLLSPSRIVR